MREAARIAQASDFIEEREGGFASEISQGGSNVSGGQRQRLSIARALAKRPEVVVFDDSFSALDYKTDALLREELARTQKDAALVVVAQRIATIMHADQIIVLDAGAVVGQGTHEELLRRCPAYLEIAQSQLSARELGLSEDEIAAVMDGSAQEGGVRQWPTRGVKPRRPSAKHGRQAPWAGADPAAWSKSPRISRAPCSSS